MEKRKNREKMWKMRELFANVVDVRWKRPAIANVQSSAMALRCDNKLKYEVRGYKWAGCYVRSDAHINIARESMWLV